MWARHGQPSLSVLLIRFQSTHPYGCDIGYKGLKGWARVSIHAPIRVRRPLSQSGANGDVFQSTHPYGCDEHADLAIAGIGVSIHAPIRVRHAKPQADSLLAGVSIHAPIRVRHSRTAAHETDQRFNPRTHTGATANFWEDDCYEQFQSTHPYGCDVHRPMSLRALRCFNPRTHTGATLMSLVVSMSPLFQSTHPYGCDDYGLTNIMADGFQSTHPYGCDHSDSSCLLWTPGFNPRTHTGATGVNVHCGCYAGFNPRTHTGATTLEKMLPENMLFQSTHPYGCDVIGQLLWPAKDVSIHAPIRVRLLLKIKMV